ncbi:hypothetical protein Dimus_014054, partial [Dionaea muscipula]
WWVRRQLLFSLSGRRRQATALPSTIGDAEVVEMVLLVMNCAAETTKSGGWRVVLLVSSVSANGDGEDKVVAVVGYAGDGRWCLMVVMVWAGGEPPRRWQPRVGLLSVSTTCSDRRR